MTVGELIEKLKKVYPDTEITIEVPSYDEYYYPYRKYEVRDTAVKVTCYGELIITVYDD